MALKSLALKHFRNFAHLDLTLHPKFNFIYGKNAQGKTNIIEAIYYLSTLKSFRTSDKNELIQNGQDFASIEACYEKDNLDWDVKITLTPQKRQVLVNQKKPKSRKEYYELFPTILFEPRHIYLFRNSPSERRRYLNRANFLQNPAFLTTLSQYEKTLQQKNRLLKDGFDLSLLDVWNEELANYGSEIIFQRQKWFENIKDELAQEYKAISGASDELHLEYQPTRNLFQDLPSPEGITKNEIQTLLQQKLKECRQREIERREAFVGPHRDDWMAFLDDREIGKYGSQGENRSAVIALKLTQLKIFSQKFNKTPLFLLDDVASELDERRCHYLFSYLRDESAQVFLTTTENDQISEEFQGRSESFLVDQGHVRVLV